MKRFDFGPLLYSPFFPLPILDLCDFSLWLFFVTFHFESHYQSASNSLASVLIPAEVHPIFDLLGHGSAPNQAHLCLLFSLFVLSLPLRLTAAIFGLGSP
jgi:hypothetical protein